MDTDRRAVNHILGRLQRIISAHARIDELPVPLKGGGALSSKEVHCLQAIGQNQGSNVKTIGDLLGVTKSAASQMSGKLADKGFIVKQAAPDNDKEILVFLTEQGWGAFQAHQNFHERHMQTLMDRLASFTPEQLRIIDLFLEAAEGIMRERMSELFGE
ncbi:MAG: MarR family transcriptional regulator [Desulfovibrionaceae bacterium]